MKLLDYIRGSRKGKEVHRLEKEAMRDPFLADAMDGYSDTTGNQEENIRILRERITLRAVRKQRLMVVWSVAASLLVGAFLGGYFLLNTQPLPDETRLALEQQVVSTSENEGTPDQIAKSSPEDSTAIEKIFVTDNRVLKSRKPVSSVPEAILQEIYDEADKDVEVDLPLAEPIPIAKGKSTIKVITIEDTKQASGRMKMVHGKVVDEAGEPLIGALVAVKGTSKGVVSDIQGKFSLEIGKNEELAVSYIGYESVTLPANTQKDMLIAMAEDRNTLDEVVVVGYGSKKGPSITGSVSMLRISGASQPEIGNKAFRQYLKENLVHPTDTLCLHTKGKVVLNFRVDSNGRPTDIQVKKSLCPSADKEAIRLIEEGPDWVKGDKEAKITIRFR